MKAYVLNLPEATDRLEAFTKNYPQSLPPFERWDMKTAEEVEVPYWWRTPARFWSNAQNFIDMFESCAAGDEPCMLFEDDCIFRPDFDEKYAAFMKEVPEDWEYITLGAFHRQKPLYPPFQVSENVLRPRYFFGTHAIMVKPAFAKKCAEHLKREHWGCRHVPDQHIGLMFINPDAVKVYCPLVSLCGQGAFKSHLTGRECTERWFMNFKYLDMDKKLVQAQDPYVVKS